ncbi:hypothetical protein BT69DRAFT_1299993 [Atractiella rhizophila]|nr:hypothetical protein BT69DRAFT_1299993 [Atractiella rhizophila]
MLASTKLLDNIGGVALLLARACLLNLIVNKAINAPVLNPLQVLNSMEIHDFLSDICCHAQTRGLSLSTPQTLRIPVEADWIDSRVIHPLKLPQAFSISAQFGLILSCSCVSNPFVSPRHHEEASNGFGALINRDNDINQSIGTNPDKEKQKQTTQSTGEESDLASQSKIQIIGQRSTLCKEGIAGVNGLVAVTSSMSCFRLNKPILEEELCTASGSSLSRRKTEHTGKQSGENIPNLIGSHIYMSAHEENTHLETGTKEQNLIQISTFELATAFRRTGFLLNSMVPTKFECTNGKDSDQIGHSKPPSM